MKNGRAIELYQYFKGKLEMTDFFYVLMNNTEYLCNEWLWEPHVTTLSRPPPPPPRLLLCFLFLSSIDLDKVILAFSASHCSVSFPIPASIWSHFQLNTAHLGCSDSDFDSQTKTPSAASLSGYQVDNFFCLFVLTKSYCYCCSVAATYSLMFVDLRTKKKKI